MSIPCLFLIRLSKEGVTKNRIWQIVVMTIKYFYLYDFFKTSV